MTAFEKVLYIQKSVNLSDRDFCHQYKIKYSDFKSWKKNEKEPALEDIEYLIKYFQFDELDFFNELSTIEPTPKTKEHKCAFVKEQYQDGNVIYEDFAREENARYEEKD